MNVATGLPTNGVRNDAALVAVRRLQRAIGVIYRPDTERQSHYFYTPWPSSSMQAHTSTKPAQWSRWTRARCKSAARRLRLSHQAFNF